MPSRSGMRRTRGRPEPDNGFGSGSGLKLGGEGLKTCGIIVFPQENLTLFAEPNRAPMEPKAGLLCAGAARGVLDFLAQNQLRNGTGTGTGTSTYNILSFSCGFCRAVGKDGV